MGNPCIYSFKKLLNVSTSKIPFINGIKEILDGK